MTILEARHRHLIELFSILVVSAIRSKTVASRLTSGKHFRVCGAMCQKCIVSSPKVTTCAVFVRILVNQNAPAVQRVAYSLSKRAVECTRMCFTATYRLSLPQIVIKTSVCAREVAIEPRNAARVLRHAVTSWCIRNIVQKHANDWFSRPVIVIDEPN